MSALLDHLALPEHLVWGEGDRYAPPSLTGEGFIHASYEDKVIESAETYFSDAERDTLVVLVIDPARLDVPLDVASTPRGPMPHVHGSLPRDAVHATLTFAELRAQLAAG